MHTDRNRSIQFPIADTPSDWPHKMMYVIIVIAFLDLFVQFPIMSPFALRIGADAFQTGLIMGAYSLTGMAGNIGAGKWIDSYGSRIVLTVGLALTGLTVLLYLLVQTPVQLLVLRLAHGFVGGMLAPAVFTMVSRRKRANAHDRPEMSMVNSAAAVGIASIVGPALSGMISGLWGASFVFAGMGILLVAAGLGMHLLPVSESAGNTDSAIRRSGSRFMFRPHHRTWPSYIGAFGMMTSIGVIVYVLPLKVEATGLGASVSGALISTFGIVAVLIFVLPTRRLYEAFGVKSRIVFGLVLQAAAMGMLYVFTDLRLLFAAMAIFGTGFALLFPSLTKLLADTVPKQDRGKAFGLFYAIYSLGVVFGSVVIAGMFAHPTDAPLSLAAVSLLVTAVLIGALRTDNA